MTHVAETAPSRLSRRLQLRGAVVVGLGSMLGAGVFAAFGPAARAAGSTLLLGLVAAGVVAGCNATSSARLAVRYPTSGGTYVYGRERLGDFWGYLAGSGFVVGKLASCAAMALTFGNYVWPSFARPLAAAAVLVLTGVNVGGIDKTVGVTSVIVAVVLASLTVFVIAALGGGTVSTSHLSDFGSSGPVGVLRAGGLLFFAFAGYARLATLGEEVAAPRRTIPRAIALSLGIVLVVYAVVGTSALLAAGPHVLGASPRPLRAALHGGSLSALVPAVAIGAAAGSLGVLLSLLAGVSRTAFAMAGNRDLPRFFATVRAGTRTPYRAEIAVGLIVAVTVSLVDVRNAIGFSSFCVLVYYAIANASAFTLGRRRAVPVLGFVGCLVLAFALPPVSVITGAAVLTAAALVFGCRRGGARMR